MSESTATKETESFADQVSRLEMMAEDDGETWDLSDNDKAAIRAVLVNQRRLAKKCNNLTEWHRRITNLASGWDGDGALGPRRPLSWESVARIAMDYSVAAIDGQGTNGDVQDALSVRSTP